MYTTQELPKVERMLFKCMKTWAYWLTEQPHTKDGAQFTVKLGMKVVKSWDLLFNFTNKPCSTPNQRKAFDSCKNISVVTNCRCLGLAVPSSGYAQELDSYKVGVKVWQLASRTRPNQATPKEKSNTDYSQTPLRCLVLILLATLLQECIIITQGLFMHSCMTVACMQLLNLHV